MTRDTEITGANLEIQLSGRHLFALRNMENGRRVPLRGYESPVKNLITNVGIDSCFARSFCASRNYLVLGSGTTAAAVTDTKLESATVVSTTCSLTENGVSVDSTNKYVEDYKTHTWQNTTGSTVTFNEVGLSWLSTANPDVFSRVVLPSPIAVPNGYELIDKYILWKYIPSWRTVSTPSITVNGVAHPGRAMLVGDNTYATDTSLGVTSPYDTSRSFDVFKTPGDIEVAKRMGVCEPSSVRSDFGYQRAALFTSSTAYAGMTATSDLAMPTLYAYDNLTLGTYTAGSFTNTKYYSFLASTLPGQTFYGFVIGTQGNLTHYIFRADTPFTKAANSTYHVGLRTTLARA